MTFLSLVLMACSAGTDTGLVGSGTDAGATDGGTASSSDGGTSDGGTSDGGNGDGGTGLSEPQRAGTLTGIVAWDLAFVGDVAAVAADDAGLLIIDLSDPMAPAQIASVPVGQATTVEASGTICWVGTWSGRVVAVDLSDPANPSWRSEVALAPHAVGLDVRGDQVGVTSWSGNTGSDEGWGLTLVDGNDPVNPAEEDNLSTPGLAKDVALGDTVAWVADGPDGLRLVDKTAPSAMVLGDAIDVGGDALSVARLNESSAVAVVAVGSEGLVLVDTSSGQILGTRGGLSGQAQGVTVDDRAIAWVATGSGGLAVLDVNDPSDPVLRYELTTGGDALTVGVSDTLIGVAADSGGVAFFTR